MTGTRPILLVCDCVSWRLDFVEQALERVFGYATNRHAGAEIAVGYRARDDLALISVSIPGDAGTQSPSAMIFEARLPGLRVLQLSEDSTPARLVEARGLASCDVIIRSPSSKEVASAIRMRLGTLADSRAAVRLRLAIPVRFETAGGFVDASTSDLSAGGAFVKTTVVPTVGDELVLKFFPSSERAPVEAKAKVMRLAPEGFGVRMTLDAKAQAELYRRIRTLRAPSPAATPMPAPVTTGVSTAPAGNPARAQRRDIAADIAEVLRRPRARAVVALDPNGPRADLARRLSGLGFDVITCETPREAFDRLTEELLALDLLVVDAGLPEEEVTALLHRIRRAGRETELPIAAVNVNADRERDALLERGASIVFRTGADSNSVAVGLCDFVHERRNSALD